MLTIKVLIVLVVIAVGLLLALKKAGDRDEFPVKLRGWGVGVGLLLVISSFIFAGSIGQVPAGFRGVVLNFGAVTARVINEGPYIVTPISESVEMMDVQTRAYEAEAGAASRDLQDVHTKVTLNYSLNPTKVNVTYQTLRRDYLERIIKPAVQESVKAITARFDAEKLITQRAEVKSAIEDALRDRLAMHGILSETISMTDFQFSKSFIDAIEAKQVAVQDALKAENKLRQIEVEARQAKQTAEGQRDADIARAQGKKQSTILVAEGESQAILTVANAQAEANRKVNETLTEKVIQYALVKELGDDIRVIILPTGQNFILGPEVLGGGKVVPALAPTPAPAPAPVLTK